MIEIPSLETERLILRAPKFEDLEPMEVFFADPVRMKFLGGPIKRGDVWRALLRTAGHWQIRGYGFWHIEDRETGIICGYTGFLKHIEHPGRNWPGEFSKVTKDVESPMKPQKKPSRQELILVFMDRSASSIRKTSVPVPLPRDWEPR